MRQAQIYIRPVFLPPLSPVLANFDSILALDVTRTEDSKPTIITIQCCASIAAHC